MISSLHKTLGALAGLGLAFAGSALATELFHVDFSTYPNGTTYSSTFAVGGPVVTTDTGLVGTGPNKVTQAIPVPSWQVTNYPDGANPATFAGGWSAVVQGKMLKISGTNINGNGGGIRVLNNQAAPSSAQTWYVEFDYTRLASSSGILGVNFLNASGQNMLGHLNNVTFYADQWAATLPGYPKLANNGTYLLRLEVDSGTNIARAYVNNVLVQTITYASNTTAFGGIGFNIITGNATDFLIGNIRGGIVSP